ncbi:WXG100 family type VII secretion target [Nocardia sp. CA2R105]|uniref:ESAT-6-like protein n=1 Tax=Nocardia jiangxiensis TaxID=282685 RepID=A0ABW6RZT1_9NOCA|nr:MULTISPECIES: WXG100 family type VII secretion target [Nocardia]MBY8857930.1 WXG100 family type VII secretion target [Nocardia coffeae]
MAGKLEANVDQMNTFSKNMEDQHQKLITHIQSTKADQEQTTASWSGQARSAFDQFMERYYEQAQAMNNKLSTTVDSLMKAADNYSKQDEDFQQQISKQNSSLDLPAI